MKAGDPQAVAAVTPLDMRRLVLCRLPAVNRWYNELRHIGQQAQERTG
jgi:hypothetical protein